MYRPVIRRRLALFFVRAIAFCSLFLVGLGKTAPVEPLFAVVDLAVGEKQAIELPGGLKVQVRLLGVEEKRDTLRGAVRSAWVTVEINGLRVKLPSAMYTLPRTVGDVQVDCPITRGLVSNSSKRNVWALEKDARLRLWPAGSPWIRPGTFRCPVKQRWFASDTQMANEPCFVDAGDTPGQKEVYYHYGLDFGGAEGLVEVVAATGGTVVSRAGKLLPGEYPPQVKPRGDVVYIKDERGWFYRYSHLKEIDSRLKLGGSVQIGQRIGLLGKEGASGGWSHLHFDVTMPQPSGKWGITDAYAFAFQAYCEQYRPQLIAVARPHHVAWAGEEVTLDGRRSWHARGKDRIRAYTWILSDGRRVQGPTVTCRYRKPGHYSEVLKVVDDSGACSYDVVVVQVFDRKEPLPRPPTIHAVFFPTMGIRTGDRLTFKVRTFAVRPDEGWETWDFGDGSPAVRTRSDGNADPHAPDGYAVTHHRYKKPGDYLVKVSRTDDRGRTATARLWVRVR